MSDNIPLEHLSDRELLVLVIQNQNKQTKKLDNLNRDRIPKIEKAMALGVALARSNTNRLNKIDDRCETRHKTYIKGLTARVASTSWISTREGKAGLSGIIAAAIMAIMKAIESIRG